MPLIFDFTLGAKSITLSFLTPARLPVFGLKGVVKGDVISMLARKA
jgi:hypothetical protein